MRASSGPDARRRYPGARSHTDTRHGMFRAVDLAVSFPTQRIREQLELKLEELEAGKAERVSATTNTDALPRNKSTPRPLLAHLPVKAILSVS